MVSYFRPKDYIRVREASELSDLLEEYGHKAMIVGGGTLIHSLAARGVLTNIETLIDIQGLGLCYVRRDDDGNKIKIGATTTFSQLEASREILHDPAYGALRDALSYPPEQVKTVATVAGSVASSFALFDVPIALLALGASVNVRRSERNREIRLEELFKDYFENTLEKGEFISEIAIPAASPGTTSAFTKLETNSNDLAIVNVAVSLTCNAGRCQNARIFIGGGVGKQPVRAYSVERHVNEMKVIPGSNEAFKDISKSIESDVKPIDDHRASSAYRMAVTKVLVRRTLSLALARLESRIGKEEA